MNSNMHKGSNGILNGVSCTVESCIYHSNSEDLCSATHITVSEQKRSSDETDTFCGTFTSQE